jgi:hypothetical protein
MISQGFMQVFRAETIPGAANVDYRRWLSLP